MAIDFNVNAFRTELARGGLRPNQFAVELKFPIFVSRGPASVTKSRFLVNIAELPGQVVNPAIVQYRGREVKLAGDRIYAPWTATILNDSDLTIRRALEEWMNGMDNLIIKEGFIVPENYMADLYIRQLDRNGSILKSYKLIDAFPVDLSPVVLDFGANDQISTFTCTWQYQAFETDLNGQSVEGPNFAPGVVGRVP